MTDHHIVIVYILTAIDKCPRCASKKGIHRTGSDQGGEIGICVDCEAVLHFIKVEIGAGD